MDPAYRCTEKANLEQQRMLNGSDRVLVEVRRMLRLIAMAILFRYLDDYDE